MQEFSTMPNHNADPALFNVQMHSDTGESLSFDVEFDTNRVLVGQAFFEALNTDDNKKLFLSNPESKLKMAYFVAGSTAAVDTYAFIVRVIDKDGDAMVLAGNLIGE